MFHVTDVSRMSSTLVETVSIDYEDFNESFLTCGTCLCTYDGQEHIPKLLHCSHTVCRSCLERILQAQNRSDSTTLRCPICRETITIPRGGVSSFPPSFIVNQLLDLMARQRRDVIPKCSIHQGQELMFCESCDTVFCVNCAGGSHNGRGASAHTVIPFSIAIKRMSEILLYKASLCMGNLSAARDAVSVEMRRLDASSERCMEAVTKSFQDLLAMVENRQQQVMTMVTQICEEKKQVLVEQLQLIDNEKTRVQNDCQGLQQQVEVRNITKKISELNEQLDISTTLAEPRENSFMRFSCHEDSVMEELTSTVDRFGSIKISKTFPALCTAQLPQPVTHLKTTVRVTTVDYHGNPCTSGGDPLTADMKAPDGSLISTKVEDCDNGTYVITFTPHVPGKHKLNVEIFSRSIRESPFSLDVSEHNNAVCKLGKRGSCELGFIQPVSAVISREGHLYVLDTGNSRVKVLASDGKVLRHLEGQVGLDQHSSTGMALASNSSHLTVVNWRTKYVTQFNLQGQVSNKFTWAHFLEPISVAVNRQGEFVVADNGLGQLILFDSAGKMKAQIGSKGDKPGQFKLMSSVYCHPTTDDIIVTDNRLQVFTPRGLYQYEIPSGSGARGQYGGITVDRHGCYLATRTEKGKCFVEVHNASRKWLFNIDSFDDRLKRPSGLVTSKDGHVYVVDLGNDCIKKFRYM